MYMYNSGKVHCEMTEMTQYNIKEYNDKVPTTNILKSTETNSITECASEFMMNNDDCRAMFYKEDDRRCILVSQLESPESMLVENGFVGFLDFNECKFIMYMYFFNIIDI